MVAWPLPSFPRDAPNSSGRLRPEISSGNTERVQCWAASGGSPSRIGPASLLCQPVLRCKRRSQLLRDSIPQRPDVLHSFPYPRFPHLWETFLAYVEEVHPASRPFTRRRVVQIGLRTRTYIGSPLGPTHIHAKFASTRFFSAPPLSQGGCETGVKTRMRSRESVVRIGLICESQADLRGGWAVGACGSVPNCGGGVTFLRLLNH